MGPTPGPQRHINGKPCDRNTPVGAHRIESNRRYRGIRPIANCTNNDKRQACFAGRHGEDVTFHIDAKSITLAAQNRLVARRSGDSLVTPGHSAAACPQRGTQTRSPACIGRRQAAIRQHDPLG